MFKSPNYKLTDEESLELFLKDLKKDRDITSDDEKRISQLFLDFRSESKQGNPANAHRHYLEMNTIIDSYPSKSR